jgi:cell division transport system permease protein
MRSLSYFFKEALNNARKNFSTTIGGVITIFLSLLVIGVFMIASLLSDQIVRSVEDQVSISIYLHDYALESDVNSMITFIEGMPEVKEVYYVSKEESMKRFEESSTTGIVDQLDGNPFPALLEVTLSDPEKVEQVVERIMNHNLFLSIIDQPDNPSSSVKYGREIVERLFSITNTIRIVCLALVILLVFVALIFINNTIRLSILARRKEIAIMRLVGASNGFIRGPFLTEGVLQAIVGAGLAIGSLYAICNYLTINLRSAMTWLPIDLDQLNLWMIYALLLVAGVIIGLFGSAWAMRRYLKV